jgi:PST family polysaccharide transporter
MRNYWALWLGTFVSAISSVILLWSLVDWRPRLGVKFKNAHGLLGFGANLTAFNVVNFLVRNLDNILIARVWGADQLGLYDRSYRLMTFPLQAVNNPLARVMVPVLSRLRSEPERYRRTFLLVLRVVLLLSIPGIAVAASMSDRLLPFLLGSQWTAASPIFFWLSIAAFSQILGNAAGWLFISCGRTRSLMHWGFLSAAVTVTAFLVGLPWGATGVACAYAIAATLVLSPALYVWAPRGTPVRTLDLCAVLVQPLAAAAIAWLGIVLISPHVSTSLLLAFGLVLSYTVAVICQTMTISGRAALYSIGSQLNKWIRGRLRNF